MMLADLRKDYSRARFDEADAHPDPLEQFRRWLDEALAAQLPEPNAMTLATATPDGVPSSRIVLIKGVDAQGITWFTNYESRKGRELAVNPHACLLFHWVELERQVRIEGRVARTRVEESDAYFRTRPLGSRIGAWASPQSAVIAGRAALEALIDAHTATLGDAPNCPPHWGGYRLVPTAFEFWQGRPSRLHDRLRYRPSDAGDGTAWTIERLAP
ncbi:MAG: pyridoxamine 5'-phosphate oxidase [Burkholderiales bacterium]|nr:pyridoxamine 5'-phosphate oxidase [Burkholderiales bacterium]